MISIVIPAYNVEKDIGACLDALLAQTQRDECEIIVVDDGSRDATRSIAEARGVRVIAQENHGRAIARNVGAAKACGDLLLFLDSDCIPAQNWVQAMLAPMANPEIVGACGVKQTKQTGIIPRFIQMEFDYKYDNERGRRYIDFIDSATAIYRRQAFLENGCFDSQLADAEDVDLSYRLSERGYHMALAPDAIVYARHRDSLIDYLQRKFAYAYWRSQVYARYPRKIASDSRTPQTQKIQGALAGLLPLSLLSMLLWREAAWIAAASIIVFVLTTLPFVARFFSRCWYIALLSPFLIGMAAFAGGAGIAFGILRRKMR